jgi:single-strand DNA-binding protein
MASLNKAMLIGNLGRDPEIRYTQSGSAVANFSIATTDRWTDKSGQLQERTEWHNIVLFDRLADLAQSYLKKGSQVYIEGKLQTRNWEDQQGVKHYRTEVVGNVMQFLDRKPGEGSGGGGQGGATEAPQRSTEGNTAVADPGPSEEYIKDDIPF